MDKQTDWSKKIEDLRDKGLLFREISEALGISKGSVHDIWTGRIKDMMYTPATKLIALHKKLTSRQRRNA